MASSQIMDGADPRDQAIYEQRFGEDVCRERALDALQRREVFLAVDDFLCRKQASRRKINKFHCCPRGETARQCRIC